MIWRRLFPPEGGGALRRWVRVNKQLFDKSRDSEHVLKGPITLFDFASPDDAADALKASVGPTEGGWRISDDEVIGGFSRGRMALIDSSSALQRYMRGEEPFLLSEGESAEKSDDAETVSESVDFTPFIRWNGTLDTNIGETSKVVSLLSCGSVLSSVLSPLMFGC